MDNMKTRLFHMLISPIVRLLRPARARQQSLRACPKRKTSPLHLPSSAQRTRKTHARLIEANFSDLPSRCSAVESSQQKNFQCQNQLQNAHLRVRAFRVSDDVVNSININININSQQQHTQLQSAHLRALKIANTLSHPSQISRINRYAIRLHMLPSDSSPIPFFRTKQKTTHFFELVTRKETDSYTHAEIPSF